MARKASAFIPKRPHRKSRGRCQTCKRKKVKCDELQPACSYCSTRNINCIYPSEMQRGSDSETLGSMPSTQEVVEFQRDDSGELDFNDLTLDAFLPPLILTSTGALRYSELQLMHRYSTQTWGTLTVRNEPTTNNIMQNLVPQLGFAHPYLLHAILGIAAAHSNHLSPDPESERLAAVYRQKTLTSFNSALIDVSSKNYEALLTTSLLLQALIPGPKQGLTADDSSAFEYAITVLMLYQGLRSIASLRWAGGVEDLSVFPLFRREIKALPPAMYSTSELKATNPPSISMSEEAQKWKSKWQDRDPHIPLEFKDSPQEEAMPPQVIPPSLRYLFAAYPTCQDPFFQTSLGGLSALFLSLSSFGLGDDLYTRIITFPTFLSPEFIQLVKVREPRTLVILAWWFAFIRLVPKLWWYQGSIGPIVRSVCKQLEGSGWEVCVVDARKAVEEAEIIGPENVLGYFMGFENDQEGGDHSEESPFGLEATWSDTVRTTTAPGGFFSFAGVDVEF